MTVSRGQIVRRLSIVLLFLGAIWLAWIVRDGVMELSNSGNVPSDREVRQAGEVLLELPSYEQMAGTAEQISKEIQVELEKKFGIIEWYIEENGGVGGCTRAEASLGGAYSYGFRVLAPFPVSGADWEYSVEVVKTVAAKYGYRVKAEYADVSDGRYLDMTTDRGGHINAISGDVLGVWVTTDCFLTEEKKAELLSEYAD